MLQSGCCRLKNPTGYFFAGLVDEVELIRTPILGFFIHDIRSTVQFPIYRIHAIGFAGIVVSLVGVNVCVQNPRLVTGQLLFNKPVGCYHMTWPTIRCTGICQGHEKRVGGCPHLSRHWHDFGVNTVFTMARIIEGLEDNIHAEFAIFPVQLRETNVITYQKPAFDAIDLKVHEMVTRRIVVQIALGTKPFVVAVDDLSLRIDDIQ